MSCTESLLQPPCNDDVLTTSSDDDTPSASSSSSCNSKTSKSSTLLKQKPQPKPPVALPSSSLPSSPLTTPQPQLVDPDQRTESLNPLRQSEEKPTHIDGIDATRHAAEVFLATSATTTSATATSATTTSATTTSATDNLNSCPAFPAAAHALRAHYNLLSGEHKESFDSLPIVRHVIRALKQLNRLQETTEPTDLMLHPSIHAALSLIGDLAYNVDCQNQVHLVQHEAHIAVLETMRKRANVLGAAIQESACVALRCLARASSNIISIAASGGILTLLTIMRNHSSTATVQIEGFKALFNLAFDPANQDSIVVENQGLDVVRTAFIVHVDNPHVQEFGCNLLHNLAFKNTKNKVRIAEHGCVEMILLAMSNHSQAVKVQVEACR